MFELGTVNPPPHRVSFSGQADAIAIMPDSRTAYIVDRITHTVRCITVDVD
jgi:hypothetical protein